MIQHCGLVKRVKGSVGQSIWRLCAAAALLTVGMLWGTGASAACDPKVRPSTFEEFKACTYREPDTGIWIVDGDVPVVSEEALRAFYNQMSHEADAPPRGAALGRPSVELIVNRVNNADDAWPQANRCGIRYCVSRASTGNQYQQVVNAMSSATQAWSANSGVRFVHSADQDANCTPANNAVEFDVQVVSGRPFLARAFFPAQARATRNVLIDTTAFATTPPLTLEGVLRHELGHSIGFRHEHTRPEAGTCFEDNNWRPLTPYDSNSVMHYPQCNGTAGWALQLSPQDVQGSQSLYGMAASCAPTPTGSPVACSVFDDGYKRITKASDALYFRANSSVCIPDGTATGTCRKWFGRCQTTADAKKVNFSVFNDGYASQTTPSDAVYFRLVRSACVPDGTAAGKCRKWVGRPVSAGGKPAQCYLFNDGYTSLVGPTDAIYALSPGQVCMPDGSSNGTCRKWFGRCEVK